MPQPVLKSPIVSLAQAFNELESPIESLAQELQCNLRKHFYLEAHHKFEYKTPEKIKPNQLSSSDNVTPCNEVFNIDLFTPCITVTLVFVFIPQTPLSGKKRSFSEMSNV